MWLKKCLSTQLYYQSHGKFHIFVALLRLYEKKTKLHPLTKYSCHPFPVFFAGNERRPEIEN